MRKEDFFEALGELDDDMVKGAEEMMTKKKKMSWKSWGVMAACVCLVMAGGFIVNGHLGSSAAMPDPAAVQIANPIMEVSSVEEMEDYLDFEIPVLEKEVAKYIVYVEETYPRMGRVDYADEAQFRVKYGTGDISGVYGSDLVGNKEIGGVTVSYYCYNGDDSASINYAIWEKDGFTFSYSFQDGGESDIETLIKEFH